MENSQNYILKDCTVIDNARVVSARSAQLVSNLALALKTKAVSLLNKLRASQNVEVQPSVNNYQEVSQQPIVNNYQEVSQQPITNNYQEVSQQPITNNYQEVQPVVTPVAPIAMEQTPVVAQAAPSIVLEEKNAVNAQAKSVMGLEGKSFRTAMPARNLLVGNQFIKAFLSYNSKADNKQMLVNIEKKITENNIKIAELQAENARYAEVLNEKNQVSAPAYTM